MPSEYVIAAMCGCWKRESGVNPGIWESLVVRPWDWEYIYDNTGGYGLGQWTNVGTKYGRNYQRHVWMEDNGYDDSDGTGQIAFLIHEDYWTASNSVMGYSNLTEFLNSDSTDLPKLVEEFLACWEGVPGDAYTERLEAAEAFIDYIREHADDDPSNYKWYSENNYIGYLSSQQLNNVMCAYFALKGEIIGPGPGGRAGKMPFWFYCLKRI